MGSKERCEIMIRQNDRDPSLPPHKAKIGLSGEPRLRPGFQLFVLTGAGISAESGIPVFQGTNWRGHSHYELANIQAWERDPALVWEYYSHRRNSTRDAQPNAAHV